MLPTLWPKCVRSCLPVTAHFRHRTITAHHHFGRNQLSIAFENPLNLSYQLFKSLGVNFAVLISFNQVVNVVFFSADMSSTMRAPGERPLY